MKKIYFLLLLFIQYILIFQSFSQQEIEIELHTSDNFILTEVDKDFTYVLVNSNTTLKKMKDNSIADFHKMKFTVNADFSKVAFNSLASFQSAWFAEKAVFFKTEFNLGVDFSDTQFDSYANFRETKFSSTAIFKDASFNTIANFSKVEFDSIADFNAAHFSSEIILTKVTLPKYLELSDLTDIFGEIDLTTAFINPKYDTCYINLTASAIDKIRFRYKRFKLWFPKADSIGYELKANVYEQLLEKQKKEGFTQSYEKLDKEYREFQYTDSESQYYWMNGYLLNWIDKNWWGYGYDKELIIKNVLFLFLLLSLINAFILNHLISDVYVNDNIKRLLESHKRKRWISKVLVSLRYSLFYTAIIFFSFKFDMDKLKYAENLDGWKVFNLLYFFVIYLGGFVCLAYLANYVITI